MKRPVLIRSEVSHLSSQDERIVNLDIFQSQQMASEQADDDQFQPEITEAVSPYQKTRNLNSWKQSTPSIITQVSRRNENAFINDVRSFNAYPSMASANQQSATKPPKMPPKLKPKKVKKKVKGPFNLQTEIRGQMKDTPSRLLSIKFERDQAEIESIRKVPLTCPGTNRLTRHLSVDLDTNQKIKKDKMFNRLYNSNIKCLKIRTKLVKADTIRVQEEKEKIKPKPLRNPASIGRTSIHFTSKMSASTIRLPVGVKIIRNSSSFNDPQRKHYQVNFNCSSAASNSDYKPNMQTPSSYFNHFKSIDIFPPSDSDSIPHESGFEPSQQQFKIIKVKRQNQTAMEANRLTFKLPHQIPKPVKYNYAQYRADKIDKAQASIYNRLASNSYEMQEKQKAQAALKKTLKFVTFNYQTNSDSAMNVVNPDINILIQQSSTLSNNIDAVSCRKSVDNRRAPTVLAQTKKGISRNNTTKIKPFSVSNSMQKAKYPKLST